MVGTYEECLSACISYCMSKLLHILVQRKVMTLTNVTDKAYAQTLSLFCPYEGLPKNACQPMFCDVPNYFFICRRLLLVLYLRKNFLISHNIKQQASHKSIQNYQRLLKISWSIILFYVHELTKGNQAQSCYDIVIRKTIYSFLFLLVKYNSKYWAWLSFHPLSKSVTYEAKVRGKIKWKT